MSIFYSFFLSDIYSSCLDPRPRATKLVIASKHQLLGMPADVISGELQTGGKNICLCLTGHWSVLMAPQKATLDSLSTFSSYVLHRPSWTKSRKKAVFVPLVSLWFWEYLLTAEYVDERSSCRIPSDTALIFCYFNNIKFFHSYLQEYTGTSLYVLIRKISEVQVQLFQLNVLQFKYYKGLRKNLLNMHIAYSIKCTNIQEKTTAKVWQVFDGLNKLFQQKN